MKELSGTSVKEEDSTETKPKTVEVTNDSESLIRSQEEELEKNTNWLKNVSRISLDDYYDSESDQGTVVSPETNKASFRVQSKS